MIYDFRFKILVLAIFFIPFIASADSLAERVAGRILLQVEQNGEAWYVNPSDLKRYFLGRPKDAFEIMREFGVGATSNDIEKIPIGLLEGFAINDFDQDGLSDGIEDVIGTDKNNKDTDSDGYSDFLEVKNNYNPIGGVDQNIDLNFANNNRGRILIQVEKNGEAWYINPKDAKRYYLGRPSDAFDVMRGLGLGISDIDLSEIKAGVFISDNQVLQPVETPDQVMDGLGHAVILNDTEKVLAYFTPKMHDVMEYSMNHLSSESKYILGNILAGSKYSYTEEEKKVYTNTVSYMDDDITVKFYLVKNGNSWQLDNL